MITDDRAMHLMALKFLFQSGDICSSEKRAIKSVTSDITYVKFEDLSTAPLDLTPIGSVEFCLEYMHQIGSMPPMSISYPNEFMPFLKRSVDFTTYRNVPDNYFVKPYEKTKLFNGHIKGNSIESLPKGVDNELVWMSEPVVFLAEWRYYVMNNEILGFSRYDDSDENHEPADVRYVSEIIKLFKDAPVSYAIDIGLLDNGEYALVEVNDAWALGFYNWGDMTPDNYAKMIEARWEQMTYYRKAQPGDIIEVQYYDSIGDNSRSYMYNIIETDGVIFSVRKSSGEPHRFRYSPAFMNMKKLEIDEIQFRLMG